MGRPTMNTSDIGRYLHGSETWCPLDIKEDEPRHLVILLACLSSSRVRPIVTGSQTASERVDEERTEPWPRTS